VPVPFCLPKGGRKFGVNEVALHWAGDSMPVHKVIALHILQLALSYIYCQIPEIYDTVVSIHFA
jgi:hypothetical protein